MVVLAVGLLGLAGLQATSLKNSQNSYHRSVATQLAYDMTDRMRANFTEARKTAGNVYVSVQPDLAVKKTTCLSKDLGVCSSADMAQNDLFEWYQVIQGSLPRGSTGTITLTGNMFTITVSWTENRYSNGENISGTTRFQTSFQL